VSETILDLGGVADLLRVSRATVERLIARGGLPVLDLSARLPGRRQRRLLRFDRDAVLAWARARGNGAGPGTGDARSR